MTNVKDGKNIVADVQELISHSINKLKKAQEEAQFGLGKDELRKLLEEGPIFPEDCKRGGPKTHCHWKNKDKVLKIPAPEKKDDKEVNKPKAKPFTYVEVDGKKQLRFMRDLKNCTCVD